MFHNKLTFLILAGCILLSASQLSVQLENADIPSMPKETPTDQQNSGNKSVAIPETTSTSTTTAKPNSTTTSKPTTTTPAPAPYPEPTIGTWNTSCISLKFAAQVNFTYETKDNGTATGLYNVPADAKVEDDSCYSNQTQSLHLVWGIETAVNSMMLQFSKINNTVKVTMIKFELQPTSDRFPNAKKNQSIQLLHRENEFSAPLKMSYHCTRAQKLNLTETVDSKPIMGQVLMHDVQVEAFRTADAKMFSTAHDCDSSENSDIVPIAVGCALVALIVIVLVSYLCARRRSTSRGYMSF